MTAITDNQSLYFVFFDMFSHASVWMCIIVATMAALLPDIISKVLENMHERNYVNKIKRDERERLEKSKARTKLSTVSSQTSNKAKSNQVANYSYTNRNYLTDSNRYLDQNGAASFNSINGEPEITNVKAASSSVSV